MIFACHCRLQKTANSNVDEQELLQLKVFELILLIINGNLGYVMSRLV